MADLPVDQLFNTLRPSTFAASDPNTVAQQQIGVGDGNVQPAGWYGAHGYSSSIGVANLLLDPNWDHIAAQAGLVIPATPSLVALSKIRRLTTNTWDTVWEARMTAGAAGWGVVGQWYPRDFPWLVGYNSATIYASVGHDSTNKTTEMTIQSKPRDYISWPDSQVFNHLVASLRFSQSAYGSAALQDITEASITLRIVQTYDDAVKASTTVNLLTDTPGILDQTTYTREAEPLLLVTSAPRATIEDGASYRVEIVLRSVCAAGTSFPYWALTLGEPMLAFNRQPEPIPYTPLIGSWVPGQLMNSQSEQRRTAIGLKKFSSTIDYMKIDNWGTHFWYSTLGGAQVARLERVKAQAVMTLDGDAASSSGTTVGSIGTVTPSTAPSNYHYTSVRIKPSFPKRQPTYVANTTTNGTGTSVSLTRPAGAATNDLLIAAMTYGGTDAGAPTPPAGWTMIAWGAGTASRGSLAVFYRIDNGGAGPYAFTLPSSQFYNASCVCYTNVDNSQPIDDLPNGTPFVSYASGGPGTNSGSSSALTANVQLGTTRGSISCHIVSWQANVTSTPTTWTERVDQANTISLWIGDGLATNYQQDINFAHSGGFAINGAWGSDGNFAVLRLTEPNNGYVLLDAFDRNTSVSFPIFRIDGVGGHLWGPGNAAQDLRMYRGAAKTIYVDDTAGGAANINVLGNVQISGVKVLQQGTSMPGSPATNDRVFRTDRGIEYYYDGTRWLSVQIFQDDLFPTDALLPSTTSGGLINRGQTGWNAVYDQYLLTAYFWSYVATTNNGTNYWTVTLQKVPGPTSVGTFTTSADTVNTHTSHTIVINALLGTGSVEWETIGTKTVGAPGAIYLLGKVTYRLVG